MKARIRLAAIGVLAVSAFTLITGATGGVAGAATPTGYSANVTAQGLNIILFGNKLTGGNATACVNQGTQTANTGSPCDGKSTPYSAASGSGTLLTTSGLANSATASASGDSQTQAQPTNASFPYENCSALSTGGPQGASGVTLNAGVGCGFAGASNDANGNPSAWAGGEVANVGVNLGGILAPIVSAASGSSKCTTSSNQLIGGLLNTVCTVLGAVQGGASSAPVVGSLIPGVEQALQNIFDTVNNLVAGLDTVDVKVGGASAAVCPGEISQSLGTCIADPNGTVTAASSGSTLEVDALQGVGCVAGTPLLTCAANEVTHLSNENDNPTAAPLIVVKVLPAECTAVRNPTTGLWTTTSNGELIELDVNVPGAPIALNIPGNVGTSQTILGGTPLQSTITLSSSSASPVGTSATCNAASLTLNLLQSSTFPGGSSTTGAIYASLGSTVLTAANNNVTSPAPITSPAVTPAASPVAPVVPAAVVPNVTTVHTGEFWAGSLPTILLAGMGATGLALVGRRRLFGGLRSLFMRGTSTRR